MERLSKIVVALWGTVVKRLSKKEGFWRQSFLSDRKEKNGVGKIEREGSLV